MGKQSDIGIRHVFRAVLCGALFVCCTHTLAQPVNDTYKTYGVENETDNVILNAGHLDEFFEKLYQLRLEGNGRVNIVHIGDSHIQADYMTSIIRRHFHRNFGNAGRGLIVPLRVARTNEPNNFKTASGVNWKSARCVFPGQSLPIGIGGVTIETDNPAAALEIYMNDLWLDYSFNALTLFYQKDAASFDFSVRDVEGHELARVCAMSDDSLEYRTRVAWEGNVNAVKLQCIKANSDQSRAMLYGVVLENSESGVLYHTIGVNGAKYKHYHAAKYFAAQTAALDPDLFIISLGTNESADFPYLDRTFSEDIDRLVLSLRTTNPAASFILVTPQDVFRNKNKINPGIRTIRDQILAYAVDHGLAFYDLYRATGGQHSAQQWREQELLGRDGIHLTKNGYEFQGDLFYHALMKSFNSYVPTRHP